MKILNVIRAVPGEPPQKAAEEQAKLTDLCRTLGAESETLIHGGTAALSQLNNKHLHGDIFFLPTAEQESPGALAAYLQHFVHTGAYDGVIFAQDEWAGDAAVLLARLCNFSFATNVDSIYSHHEKLFFRKLVYSSSLLAEYELPIPFAVSERLSAAPAEPTSESSASVQVLPPCPKPAHILKQRVITQGKRCAPSPVLIVAGMGVGKRTDICRLRDFSLENGFDFGVTRPVAMRGWADIGEIVGVSGSDFAPKLAVVLGVSGAAPFYEGVKRSEYILSVNTDIGALMTTQADAVIVDSYENVLDGLFEMLRRYRIKRE